MNKTQANQHDEEMSDGDYEVPQPGNDGISSLTWSPTYNILASSNWDGGVRCWDCRQEHGRVHATPLGQGQSHHLRSTQKVTSCLF